MVNGTHIIRLGDRDVPLKFRRNPRARRIILRIDQETDGAVLTLPQRASEDEALALARDKADWLLDRLSQLPPRIHFHDGTVIPLLGMDYTIRHRAELRRGVIKSGGEIWVSGREEHLARRVGDWLRREARETISPVAERMSVAVGRKIKRVSVRDTKSRWGSCSVSGNLSFSWRLILTPQWVLDYVVAHEVSHLVHMNHGPAFWRTVEGFEVDANGARHWLNQQSTRLHRIGP